MLKLLIISLFILSYGAVYCFQLTQIRKQMPNIRSSISKQNIKSQGFSFQHLKSGFISSRSNRLSETKLYFDVFGVGPSELVVIVVAGALIYGPDKMKKQLREKGVQGDPVTSKGWKAEREDRIKEMKKTARSARAKRGMRLVNEAIEDGNQYVLQRMEEFDESS